MLPANWLVPEPGVQALIAQPQQISKPLVITECKVTVCHARAKLSSYLASRYFKKNT